MELKTAIEIGVLLVIGIIGFFIRREMDKQQSDNDDLRNMIKEREDRNFVINKEQDNRLNSLENRTTAIETVQAHCDVFNGKEKK